MRDDWPCAGTLLATRYRLAELLETGGMAEIWRADDELLGRPVAVKLPTGAQVAWREARMAAKLSHPGIAAVHDYREAVRADGTVAPFVVMELLAGETVAARLVRAPIGLAETARIGAAVADALAAAHANGVVHRDVKPGNVMLTPNGVKILDFGISAAAGEPDDDDTGATFGTPAYVAPERLDGMPAEPATDVYGLGVLLFEMVTGQPPYPVDTWEQLEEARLAGPSTLPEDLPEAFRNLVARCLDDDPEKRPPAGEVRFDLTAQWLSAPPAPAEVAVAQPAVPTGTARTPSHWDGPIAERITYQEPLPSRPDNWHDAPTSNRRKVPGYEAAAAAAAARQQAPAEAAAAAPRDAPAPSESPAGGRSPARRPRAVLHGGDVAVVDRAAMLGQRPAVEAIPATGHPSLPGGIRPAPGPKVPAQRTPPGGPHSPSGPPPGGGPERGGLPAANAAAGRASVAAQLVSAVPVSAAPVSTAPAPAKRRFAMSLAVVALVMAVGGIFTAVSWPRKTAETTAEPAATPTATPATPAPAASAFVPVPLDAVTSATPLPTRPSAPSLKPPPGSAPAALTFAQAVTRTRSAVLDGAATAEIRDDVVTDLLNLVDRLSKSDVQDAPAQVDLLREKLRQRAGEGSVTKSRATILQACLDDLDRAVGA
jgi:serine/threonine-protein kinase